MFTESSNDTTIPDYIHSEEDPVPGDPPSGGQQEGVGTPAGTALTVDELDSASSVSSTGIVHRRNEQGNYGGLLVQTHHETSDSTPSRVKFSTPRVKFSTSLSGKTLGLLSEMRILVAVQGSSQDGRGGGVQFQKLQM